MSQARKLVLPQHKGQAGEHLVCFDFLIRGYNAMINAFPAASADVLVDLGKGVPLRIQVKTTLTSVPRNKQRATFYAYRFKMGATSVSQYIGAEIDLFALVVLDTRCVLYVPAKEMMDGRALQGLEIRESLFAPRAANSLDRFLSAL